MDNLPPLQPPAPAPVKHEARRTRHAGHDAGAASLSGEAAHTRQRIHEHMLREIEAMTLFATESGIGVPQDVMVALDRACWETAEAGTDESAKAATPADQIALIAQVHLALTKLVAPARPGTLVLLIDQKSRHRFWHRFGAVPLVREMLGLAVVSLAIMLTIALSPQINEANMTKTLLTLQGLPLLVNEIFLLSAAAVGASLTNLKLLDRFVSACTFDPRYESSYWSRLVMGLISGVILSQLIYGALISGPSSTRPVTGGQAPDILTSLGQPILALVGGFSADLVYSILTHFISVVGNLFGGGKSGGAQTAPVNPGLPRTTAVAGAAQVMTVPPPG